MPAQPTRLSVQTITKAQALRRHLAKGQGLSIEDFDPSPSRSSNLRLLALTRNAPASVHRVLDEIGEPLVSETQCSQQAAHAINQQHTHSLLELHRQHPAFIESRMRVAPALAARMVMHKYLSQAPSPTKAMVEMVRLATQWGADWASHREEVLRGQPKKVEAFDAMVREMTAHALEQSWPVSEVCQRARPRL